MNNVPNESRILMLSYTFIIYFFDFVKFGVKPGFSFWGGGRWLSPPLTSNSGTSAHL